MDAPDDTAWPKELCADSQTLHRTVERAASDDMKPQVQYDSSLEEQDHRGKRACNGDNGSGSIQATEVLIETNEQPSTVPEVSRLTDDLQVRCSFLSYIIHWNLRLIVLALTFDLV